LQVFPVRDGRFGSDEEALKRGEEEKSVMEMERL
jgi:hypothetical protein